MEGDKYIAKIAGGDLPPDVVDWISCPGARQKGHLGLFAQYHPK
jgi:hypothetical protein